MTEITRDDRITSTGRSDGIDGIAHRPEINTCQAHHEMQDFACSGLETLRATRQELTNREGKAETAVKKTQFRFLRIETG